MNEPAEGVEVSSEETSFRVWTVGHSTRSADDFNSILLAQQIGCLVDVRSFPGSRRYPHFNKLELEKNLESAGIRYSHVPALGGRRRPSADSKNTAWQNASFRAYADHLDSVEFQKGIEELLRLSQDERTAVMCAEALWWRCHRGLIADFLKANGVKVIHILDANKTENHPYTSAARIVDGELSYRGLLPG
ncbi:MAG TPA: DUF488 domain-containing protein [Pyrinomonadaceae bacterium]|nr:DUF488 domain-containing protein [Pyrinomonadaceae bacterium]